jgi:hypothetical protein
VGVAVPGLSQAQQILSTASLFGVAKQKMPADQWEQVASSVPGADALAQEAVRQGLPSNVNGVAGLNEFLGKSGITPEQLNKVAPAVAKSLQGKVTPEVATSFVNSLR